MHVQAVCRARMYGMKPTPQPAHSALSLPCGSMPRRVSSSRMCAAFSTRLRKWTSAVARQPRFAFLEIRREVHVRHDQAPPGDGAPAGILLESRETRHGQRRLRSAHPRAGRPARPPYRNRAGIELFVPGDELSGMKLRQHPLAPSPSHLPADLRVAQQVPAGVSERAHCRPAAPSSPVSPSTMISAMPPLRAPTTGNPSSCLRALPGGRHRTATGRPRRPSGRTLSDVSQISQKLHALRQVQEPRPGLEARLPKAPIPTIEQLRLRLLSEDLRHRGNQEPVPLLLRQAPDHAQHRRRCPGAPDADCARCRPRAAERVEIETAVDDTNLVRPPAGILPPAHCLGSDDDPLACSDPAAC